MAKLIEKIRLFFLDSSLFFIVVIVFAMSFVGYVILFYHLDNQNLSEVDVIYFTFVIASTVGFGDISPQTQAMRLITIPFIAISGVFWTITIGTAISKFSEYREKRKGGMLKVHSKVDLLIVGFPVGGKKVKRLVSQLRADSRYSDKKIVLITDKITERAVWMDELNIEFVYGKGEDEETLERANIKNTDKAIVLAENQNDENSDKDTAYSLTLIETINLDVFSIAEKVRESDTIFKGTNADYVVDVLSADLLAQEILDPGAIALYNTMFNNKTHGTQYNLIYSGKDITWREIKEYLDQFELILLGYYYNGEYVTIPKNSEEITKGTIIKYIADEKLDFGEFEL